MACHRWSRALWQAVTHDWQWDEETQCVIVTVTVNVSLCHCPIKVGCLICRVLSKPLMTVSVCLTKLDYAPPPSGDDGFILGWSWASVEYAASASTQYRVRISCLLGGSCDPRVGPVVAAMMDCIIPRLTGGRKSGGEPPAHRVRVTSPGPGLSPAKCLTKQGPLSARPGSYWLSGREGDAAANTLSHWWINVGPASQTLAQH